MATREVKINVSVIKEVRSMGVEYGRMRWAYITAPSGEADKELYAVEQFSITIKNYCDSLARKFTYKVGDWAYDDIHRVSAAYISLMKQNEREARNA